MRPRPRRRPRATTCLPEGQPASDMLVRPCCSESRGDPVAGSIPSSATILSTLKLAVTQFRSVPITRREGRPRCPGSSAPEEVRGHSVSMEKPSTSWYWQECSIRLRADARSSGTTELGDGPLRQRFCVLALDEHVELQSP